MSFAVPLKCWIPTIVTDTSYHGGNFRMLHSSSLCSFSKSKPRISLQTSSLIKRTVFACSNDRRDENYAPNPKAPAKEVSLDIKLPRRNMIVQFTCNSCGERTQRKISRVAYERGTIFVQCAGCLANHKLVDNLGLVVEYDFRENLDTNFEGTP